MAIFRFTFICAFAVLVALSAVPARAAEPVPPTTYTVIKDGKPLAAVPIVALNDSIEVLLDGEGALDPAKLAVRVDGSRLSAIRQVGQRTFSVDFVRDDDNAADWARVLGSPFLHAQVLQRPLFVQYDNVTLAPKDSPGQIELKTYNGWMMLLGVGLVAIIVAAGIIIGRTSWLVRDRLVPQLPFSQASYSLGRIQMLLWTDVIVASFVFLFVITWGVPSVSASAVSLMGIAGATGLAAIGVDTALDAKARRASALLTRVGLASQDDVQKLLAGRTANNGANPVTDIQGANIPAKGAAAANPSPTYRQLMDEYERITADFRTAGFLKDLTSDANGPTLHRWQIVIWTPITAGVFIFLTHKSIAMPDLPETLLTLIGISGAIYVGFKFPEKQG